MRVALSLPFVFALAACGGQIDETSLYANDDAGGGPLAQDAGAREHPDAAPPTPTPDPTGDVDGEDASNDGTTCCSDAQNTSYPPDTNCTGTALAWAYTPKCDLVLTRISLHATGGLARVYDSNANGRPGTLLFEGKLPSSTTAQFLSTAVSPSLRLHAGHKYFLGKDAGMCSIASDGVQQEYYGWWDGSGWDGPYHWHPFTAKLEGDCK